MFAGGSCLKLCLSKLESFKSTDSNDQVLTGGLLVLNFPRIYFAESVKFSQTLQDVGANFFLLFLVFSLTCYRVFFYFLLSGILLITLLCYVLFVNFVIVCYLTPIYY